MNAYTPAGYFPQSPDEIRRQIAEIDMAANRDLQQQQNRADAHRAIFLDDIRRDIEENFDLPPL